MALTVVTKKLAASSAPTHPAGCARSVDRQIESVLAARLSGVSGPRNVLVIGASTGYGLASRIAAAWGFAPRRWGL